jgi:hypothetical protein
MAKIGTVLVVGGGVAGLTTAAALIGTASRRNSSSAGKLGTLGVPVFWSTGRMLLSLGLGAGFCGAIQVPASGLNARSCNVRYCRVSPMCAADSARRPGLWCRTIVGSRSRFSDCSTGDYDIVVGAAGISPDLRRCIN